MGRLLAVESVVGLVRFSCAIGTLHVRLRVPVFFRAGVSLPEGEFTGVTDGLCLTGAAVAWGAFNGHVGANLRHLLARRKAIVDSVFAEFSSGARLACWGVIALFNVLGHLANGLLTSERIADRVCWAGITGGGR